MLREGRARYARSVSRGVMHPEFIGALMPIGGTTRSDAEHPVGNWTFQLMTAAIQSDPVWQSTKGDYYKLQKEKHPVLGAAFGWAVLGAKPNINADLGRIQARAREGFYR